MILPLIKVDDCVVIQTDQFTVDPRSRIAMLDERLHYLLKLALASADDGGHDHDPIFGAKGHHPLHNLIGGLSADATAALRTMRQPDGGEEQAKIIVNFRDRSDGRSGAAAGGLLLDRD